jgi:RNA polymerase sigma factor (sigma-70 family)
MSGLRGSKSVAVILPLERLFNGGTLTGSSEVELLHRFVTGRDEAAFEAIVARHGPMVLGVCRQLLRDHNDVDDAFQATFLVLIRKAGSLKRCDLLGNWLYGVAHRVAVRAQSMAARRTARAAAAFDAARSGAQRSRDLGSGICEASTLETEPDPWLHQEIARLPEKYRAPIVLCYMEGLTHENAALRLKWPLGTVKGRLARARDLLRKRLARRGITLSAATLAASLSTSDSRAAVPTALIEATLRAAESVSSHPGVSLAASSTVSLTVAALGEGVVQAMTLTQLKAIALPLILAGAVTTSVVAFAAQVNPKRKKIDPHAPPPTKRADRQPKLTTLKPPPESDRKSTAAVLREQLLADQELFDSLVIPRRDLEHSTRDLVRWSLRLLDASRLLSAGPQERAAAYSAHRDRMKRLLDLADQSSAADGTRAMLRAQLKEAEELLQSEAKAGVHEPAAQVSSPVSEAGPTVAQRLSGEGSQAAQGASGPGPLPSQSSPAQGPLESRAGMTGMMMAGRNSMMGGGSGPAPGGGGGGMAGMMGMNMRAAMSPDAIARQQRRLIAGNAAEIAAHSKNPRDAVIQKKLDEPISMSFNNPTPLDDILKYLKQATTSPTFAGVPIYVDPKGLDDAKCTLMSPVALDLEGIPLRTTLRLALKQLGLAYCVRDGVLIISSVQGISEELAEERSELDALTEQKDRGLQ